MNSFASLQGTDMGLSEGILQGLLSSLVSRSKQSARSVAPIAVSVLKGLVVALDDILLAAIETRTKEEFVHVRDTRFSDYARLTRAISDYVTAVIPKTVRQQLVRGSIWELEADFREKGLESFGEAVRDQAIFTIWTLGKINDLTTTIVENRLAKKDQKEDRECCAHFTGNALFAQFNLDCLSTALRRDKAIYPNVLDEIVDGLRAMVNAYAYVRRGLKLRIPAAPDEAPTFSANDEDHRLMDFAYSEAVEFLGEESQTDVVVR